MVVESVLSATTNRRPPPIDPDLVGVNTQRPDSTRDGVEAPLNLTTPL
ncbi:hypothetical protein Isop_3715 [Isosphaera pallida ATCC 43644]|uniref:Uncharacterized protein n=1 Tax=Isosphaera pallida (strain ATCC 43644 / DSM 9630 / IS1B) TaxID=575540 RepID=E8QZZ5_ISOPI|nr:hypothetical protein Isop_3715 [Isosphaera pallida ATCC 43644]